MVERLPFNFWYSSIDDVEQQPRSVCYQNYYREKTSIGGPMAEFDR